MLNNTNIIRLGSNSQTVNFNAPCTGILQRSHSKSKFIKAHSTSKFIENAFQIDGSESLIDTTPEEQWRSDKKYKPITILQILVLGDSFLIEYVFNTDLIEEIKE